MGHNKPNNNAMGILISCLSIVKSQYKTSDPSQSTRTKSSAPAATKAQAPASAPTTSSPGPQDHNAQPLDPTPAPEGEEKEKKGSGNSVVTPVLGTSTTTSTSTTTPAKMATDEDYMSFLDKANKDPSEGTAKTQGSANGNGKMEFKATEKGVKVPEVIEEVLGKGEAFYTSDADEPFVGVALKLEGKGLPDEATFAKLINHPKPKEADVQIMDVGEWDTQGQ